MERTIYPYLLWFGALHPQYCYLSVSVCGQDQKERLEDPRTDRVKLGGRPMTKPAKGSKCCK